MRVPFFDYSEIYKTDYSLYSKALDSVIKRADFILREDLIDFENNITRYTKSSFCAGVGNGTDALWLSLKALEIKNGDEVIIPSHTYVATADAVWAVGATPVLVDIGADHLIAPDAIEGAISPNTRAIIPVNLNGRVAQMEKINKIASKNELYVIEDNAQGLGATLNGKMSGTFGATGTLSFYPAKILGGLGDGGAILTQNKDLYEKIILLRNHGRDTQNEIISWGYNSRLDNLQAAVLNAKLKYLDEMIVKRRLIASIYDAELKDCNQVFLPTNFRDEHDRFDTYQNFEIECNDRDELMVYLKNHGVGTIIQWGGKGLHNLNLPGIVYKDLNNTDKLLKKMLLLPMNHYMTEEQALYISRKIKLFYSKK